MHQIFQDLFASKSSQACQVDDSQMALNCSCTIQEYERQQEDAALTEEEKQARQQKADADQAAMWESIGNVSLLPLTLTVNPKL